MIKKILLIGLFLSGCSSNAPLEAATELPELELEAGDETNQFQNRFGLQMNYETGWHLFENVENDMSQSQTWIGFENPVVWGPFDTGADIILTDLIVANAEDHLKDQEEIYNDAEVFDRYGYQNAEGLEFTVFEFTNFVYEGTFYVYFFTYTADSLTHVVQVSASNLNIETEPRLKGFLDSIHVPNV